MMLYYLDDEILLCEMFKEFMEDENIKVRVFTDSQLAINACEELEPDLIFIDYRLGGATGDKVALRMKSTIAKILVTGELNFPDVKGFDLIISKPYQLKKMKNIVNGYC